MKQIYPKLFLPPITPGTERVSSDTNLLTLTLCTVNQYSSVLVKQTKIYL